MAKLQVRKSTYRGKDGYTISGTDSRDRNVRIFCRLEHTARNIVQALKLGDHDRSDRLLRDEPTPKHWQLAGRDATLGVGHVWTAQGCPAYSSCDPAQCICAARTCRHCDRPIVTDANGTWVDPLATGDDDIWRESCDSRDTFTAEHEPTDI